MKKALPISFILIFSFLSIFSIAHAAGISAAFGGTVIGTKATPIETLESSGWICAVPGTSLTIKPVSKTPIHFLIPFGVKSKTSHPTRIGQWILGIYNQTTTTITCTFPDPPATTTVTLNPITLYGTSK